MREQVHGGDIYRNKVVTDFSVNSNPLGLRREILEAVTHAVGEMEHYPDIQCERLREAIGRYESVPVEQILCGNGAAELFYAAAFGIRPSHALIPAPTFVEYEKALRAAGCDIVYHELREEEGFVLKERILDAITEELDLLVLCNPNNPTGVVTDRALLVRILERCQRYHVRVLLDECFTGFLSEPKKFEMKMYLEQYPNLMIVKAFTKIFAMPGLRLGYALSADRKLLCRMMDCLQPWNVSIPAQEGGAAALRDCGAYLQDTRAYVAEERHRIKEALRELGCAVYDSEANYVFFRGQAELYERALEAGYLIRDCQNYRGLSEGYYRIAVRTREENERFIRWLRQL